MLINGRVGTLSVRQQLASAGKYFNVTNPTPGTAVAYANKVAYSTTANGLLSVSNNNPSESGINIYLDTLALTQTATAPTDALVYRFEVFTETGIRALSAGNLARTPVNINPSFSDATGAVVNSFSAAAGTMPAAVGTRKIVDIIALQTGGQTVIHDTMMVAFGADGILGGSGTALTAARASSSSTLTALAAPVIITPQNSIFITSWTLTGATNVPSYEFSLKYFELNPND